MRLGGPFWRSFTDLKSKRYCVKGDAEGLYILKVAVKRLTQWRCFLFLVKTHPRARVGNRVEDRGSLHASRDREEVTQRSNELSWSPLPQSFSGPSIMLGEEERNVEIAISFETVKVLKALRKCSLAFFSIHWHLEELDIKFFCWCFSFLIVANYVLLSLQEGVSQTLPATPPKGRKWDLKCSL